MFGFNKPATSTPAFTFGNNANNAGSTPASGNSFGFGQTQQPANNNNNGFSFGTASTANTANAFGATKPFAFGQTNTNSNTNTNTNTGGFGFGANQMNAMNPIGMNSLNSLNTNSPFGQPTQPQTSQFNQSGFGFSAANTSQPAYEPVKTMDPLSNSRITVHNICAMPAYKGQATEELRAHDYKEGRKVATAAAPGTAGIGMNGAGTGTGTTSGFGFGQQNQNQNQAQNQSGFGFNFKPAQTSSNAFGAPAAAGTSTGFGFGNANATSANTNTTTPAFSFGQGAQPAQNASPFGQSTFGTNTTAANSFNKPFSFGQQAQTQTQPFGQTSFGNTGSTSTFGQPAQPAQPAQSAFSFGQNQNQTAQPAANSNTAKPFSFGQPAAATTTQTSTPFSFTGNAFNQPAAQPAAPTSNLFSFGQPQQTQGATNTQPAQTNPFGQTSTTQPASNTPFSFASKPAGNTFSFGQPAAPATTTNPFGSTTNSFNTTAPKPATTTSSLFAAPTTNNISAPSTTFPAAQPQSTFSFSTPAAGTQLSQTQTQIATVDQNPYGANPLFDSVVGPAAQPLFASVGPALKKQPSTSNQFRMPQVSPQVDRFRYRGFTQSNNSPASRTKTIEALSPNAFISKPSVKRLVIQPKPEAKPEARPTFDAHLETMSRNERLGTPSKNGPMDNGKIASPASMPRHSLASAQTQIPTSEGTYYTVPSLAALREAPHAELSAVQNFVVGKVGTGKIQFTKPVNLTQIKALKDIPGTLVQFTNRECEVYPEGTIKPPVGEALNQPAIITLDGCWPLDKATRQPIVDPQHPKLINRIKELKAIEHTHFQSYTPETGTWVFSVDDFGDGDE